MSYGVALRHRFKVVTVDPHMEGGNVAIGGDDEARMSVTSNYSALFKAAFDGIGFKDALNDKKAQDVIPLLEKAVERLGDKPDEDYWAKTEGNAGHALAVLLGWARQHPTAVFTVGG